MLSINTSQSILRNEFATHVSQHFTSIIRKYLYDKMIVLLRKDSDMKFELSIDGFNNSKSLDEGEHALFKIFNFGLIIVFAVQKRFETI